MPFRCPYCFEDRPDDQATKEHVIPKAMGGGLEPTNPLALEPVCRRCNSLCGRYIDGPYLRSWLVNNLRAENQRTYLDLRANPVMGLVYLGTAAALAWEDRICELWLGPAGDRICHFHRPYPVELARLAQVGGPIPVRDEEFDPGFVMIFVQATNPAWHETIVRSTMDEFPDSTIYFGNSNPPRGSDRLRAVPPELQPLHERLRAMNGQQHQVELRIQIDAGDRFLAKVAVGMGALLLRPEYVASEDASSLRGFMWGRTPEEREPFRIRGASFHDDQDPAFNDLLSWKPGHVLVLMPTVIADGPLLALYCNFYGSQPAFMQVARNAQLWSGKVPRDGLVFLIAPGRRRWFGPVPAAAYALAKHDSPNAPAALRDFMVACGTATALPPFHL